MAPAFIDTPLGRADFLFLTNNSKDSRQYADKITASACR
jgi:hypothetical protein